MYILNKHNKPKSLKDVMESDFDPSEMGPGYRRGMVLKIYKSKIKKLTGGTDFLADLKGARMSQRDEADYKNPILYINFRPGSPWLFEMHQRRYQLKMLINKRLKCQFIKEVRVK